MLTVSGTAVALLVFCFVSAVQDGLHRLTQDKQAQRTLIVFQENRFCPTSSRLPQDYERHIAKQAGVTDVVPIKVFTNNCRASLDAIVFQGMPAEKLKACRDIELDAGNWTEFDRQDDGALVGKVVAARRGLSVGEKFTIGDVTVLVTGIFRSAQDRIREHGVLQTIGLRPRWIFQLVVCESVLLSSTGGLLGIGLGLALLALAGFSIAAEGVSIAFRPSLELAMIGAIVSVGVGLVAGLIPGWQAARAKIVDALTRVG